MPNGLVARFAVSPSASPSTPSLASLPLPQQLENLSGLLKHNELDQKFSNYALANCSPPALQRLAVLSPHLPLPAFTLPSSPAYQPLGPTPLNNLIAAGRIPSLAYYTYLIEGFVSTRKDADEFVRRVKSTEWRTVADEADLRVYVDAMLEGLERSVAAGCWDGRLKRVSAYAGWSDGWEGGEDDETPAVRTYQHFTRGAVKSLHILVLRILAQMESSRPGTVQVFVNFVSTTLPLPSSTGYDVVMAPEALLFISRSTSTCLGGCNVNSGGLAVVADAMRNYLNRVAPDTPLALLSSLSTFPHSLAMIINKKYGSTHSQVSTVITYLDVAPPPPPADWAPRTPSTWRPSKRFDQPTSPESALVFLPFAKIVPDPPRVRRELIAPVAGAVRPGDQDLGAILDAHAQEAYHSALQTAMSTRKNRGIASDVWPAVLNPRTIRAGAPGRASYRRATYDAGDDVADRIEWTIHPMIASGSSAGVAKWGGTGQADVTGVAGEIDDVVVRWDGERKVVTIVKANGEPLMICGRRQGGLVHPMEPLGWGVDMAVKRLKKWKGREGGLGADELRAMLV